MINIRTAILSATPETLQELALKRILKIMSTLEVTRQPIPHQVGQLILSAVRDHILINCIDSDDCAKLLASLTRRCTILKEIDLSGLPVTEDVFKQLIAEYKDVVEHINVSACTALRNVKPHVVRSILDDCKDTLHTLIVGGTFSDSMYLDESQIASNTAGDETHHIFPQLKLKTLIATSIHPRPLTDLKDYDLCLSMILVESMSETLTYLDLSNSVIAEGRPLTRFKNLKTLILFNCSLTYPHIISNICELQNLRTLDLSQEYQEGDDFILNTFEEDQYLLNDLITKLPNLTSLDISCTGLVLRKDRQISVLETRKDRPFNFLGLFHTTNATIGTNPLPARIVASEANESHILNALRAYLDRPRQLITALSDLFNLYKATSHQETFDNVSQAMELVLEILTRHLTQQQVIITGTAVLWYIIKINMTTKTNYDTKVMKTVTTRLLDAMHYHKDAESILINGGLILLFLPDLVYEYARVAVISLHMCQNQSSRLRNFGTSLMNHLACQVCGEQKLLIGNLGAIEVMMDIIKMRIDQGIGDETLESAWCTLWNITDETVENCKRFLDYDGIKAFKECMDKFRDNKELIKNMMGLLGNVAESKIFRAQFMEPDILHRFIKLLSNPFETIECSYNACGILAHIMSDGEEAWGLKLPRRELCLGEMKAVIDSWPINSKRYINYRSFEPIVRLLKPSVPGEAQYWALFALTNLTRVDPAKYCPMLVPHGGLESLEKIVNRAFPTEDYVYRLAKVTLYQYQRFQEKKTLSGLEMCDSIYLDEVKNFIATGVETMDLL